MRSTLLGSVLTLAWTAGAGAAEPAQASGETTAVVAPTAAAPKRERRTEARAELPWIRRWRPERHLLELGIFGGVFVANPDHDLYDPRTAPQEPLWAASPDVGVRLGYFPLRPLGVEAEFSAVPTRVRSITNDFAFVYGFRGHVIAQLPYYNVVPFFLAGYGLLGVRSNLIVLGDDVDPAFHYGGGLKVFFNRWVGARVEARNIVTAAEARQNSGTSHVQVLAGLTFTFLRAKEPAPKKVVVVDPDRDHDGILNADDACPDAAGVAPHGCPDTDGDGFRDLDDACPEVPGVAPEGCPIEDTDGDGIMDPDDDCVDEPETFNGHEDRDGCPDELPPEVKEFNGTIAGIEFDFNEDTIRPSSQPVLDKAIETLTEYPEIRVKITGHTDDVGSAEFNLDLSRRRAEAVKRYIVAGGVDESRIETVGKGSTEPKVPNDSDANRGLNRRIDFEVLKQDLGGSTQAPPAVPEGAAPETQPDAAVPADSPTDPPDREPPAEDPS